MGMKILIEICFSLKKDSRTRGHEVKLVKDQRRLDIRKYSFSQRTIRHSFNEMIMTHIVTQCLSDATAHSSVVTLPHIYILCSKLFHFP